MGFDGYNIVDNLEKAELRRSDFGEGRASTIRDCWIDDEQLHVWIRISRLTQTEQLLMRSALLARSNFVSNESDDPHETFVFSLTQ